MFSSLFLDLVSLNSYQNTTSLLNKSLHRNPEEEAKEKTLEEYAGRVGKDMLRNLNSQAEHILEAYNVDTDSGIPTEQSSLPEAACRPSVPYCLNKNKIAELAAGYNEKRKAPDEQIPLDAPRAHCVERSADRCCYISVDDILSKAQKDSRAQGSERKHKFLHNTIVHIQYDGKSYCLAAPSMDNAFKILFAFLLSNKLMENTRLVFISDGAHEIKDYVRKYFWFRKYSFFLDWFHLGKKCEQYLSMAIKGGKDKKQEIRNKITSILWAGNVNGARKYLEEIDERYVKSKDQLDKWIGYLDRKSEDIPCYALRSMVGVRNSSNPVEKANDIVVAQRQKHNGMSWSKDGSSALAAITAARHNGNLDQWLDSGILGFAMAS